MFCLLLYFVLGGIQIWLESKRGGNISDRQFRIKLARRNLPILLISAFFAPVSWTARICVVILAVAAAEGVTYLVTYRPKQKKE
jgi:hypothetical protein